MLIDCEIKVINDESGLEEMSFQKACISLLEIESIAQLSDLETCLCMKSGDQLVTNIPYDQMRIHYNNAFFGVNVKRFSN